MQKANYNDVVKQLYSLCPKEVQKRVNEQSELYAKNVRYHSFFTDETYYKREVDYELFSSLILLEMERAGLIEQQK